MEPFTLQWAAQSMGGKIAGAAGDPNALVTSVCVDSRQARPGALFFALRGEKSDGHAYVTQALRAGAVGVVVSHILDTAADTAANAITEGATTAEKSGNGNTNRSTNGSTEEEVEGAQIVVPAPLRALGDLARRYRRQFAIPIVGVTGSVGKTSTKEMIAQVLRTTYHTLASDKNYNNEIGVPLTLFNLDKTHQAAVVEMGMRGLGQIDYLAEIAEPTIGVITNIGSAHIELLGSYTNIVKAKAELFARLPSNGTAIFSDETARHALEPDDIVRERVRTAARSSQQLHIPTVKDCVPTGCRIITFSRISIDPRTDVRCDYRKTQIHADGTVSFRVRVGPTTQSLLVKLQAVGTHHVPNALAALAVGSALNVPTERAIAALEAWRGAEGRMAVRHTTDNITVLDDCYNASPESMRGALETLGKMTQSGVAVLGDMKELGSYAEQAHRSIGKNVYVEPVGLLVTVGTLAKFIHDDVEERINHIKELKQLQQPSKALLHFATAQEAAAQVNDWIKPGDTVLVKGSRAMGMEVIVDALMARTSGTADEKAHA